MFRSKYLVLEVFNRGWKPLPQVREKICIVGAANQFVVIPAEAGHVVEL